MEKGAEEMQTMKENGREGNARLGGGVSLSKSFRSAMGGEGGGVLRGSMRLSALRRKQREEDRLKLIKEEKKLRYGHVLRNYTAHSKDFLPTASVGEFQ